MELHTYYSKSGLLKITWGDRIDMDSIFRHFELLKANTHYERRLRMITSSDIEEVGIPLTQQNMLVIQKWREEALASYESTRTAIYNLRPVPAAYLNYFSEFFDSPKSCLKQFPDEETALSWLMKNQSVGH